MTDILDATDVKKLNEKCNELEAFERINPIQSDKLKEQELKINKKYSMYFDIIDLKVANE
jgi:hypothetical protein